MMVLVIISLIISWMSGICLYLNERNSKWKNTLRVIISIPLSISLLIAILMLFLNAPIFFPAIAPLNRYTTSDYFLEYEIDGVRSTRSGVIKCMFKELAAGWGTTYRDYITTIKTDDEIDEITRYCYLGNVMRDGTSYDICLVLPKSDSGYFLREPNEYPDVYDGTPEFNLNFSEKPTFISVSSGGLRKRAILQNEFEDYKFRVIDWKCDPPRFNVFVPYSLGWNIIFIFSGVCFITFKILRKYD